MPLVHIYMNEGRTVEEKRNLAKSVTEAVVQSVKVKPEEVLVLIHDLALTNSAKAGVLRIDR
ncbi:MAG: tautomerase family protein [Thaumarchaeota archaeon]|nr:tautomerase family protein [Nitrososphaerota archaeon]